MLASIVYIFGTLYLFGDYTGDNINSTLAYALFVIIVYQLSAINRLTSDLCRIHRVNQITDDNDKQRRHLQESRQYGVACNLLSTKVACKKILSIHDLVPNISS